MCTSGGRKARSEQLSTQRRGVATTYQTSEFVGGTRNFSSSLNSNKIPDSVAAYSAFKSKSDTSSFSSAISANHPMSVASQVSSRFSVSDPEGGSSMKASTGDLRQASKGWKADAAAAGLSVANDGTISVIGKGTGRSYAVTNSGSIYNPGLSYSANNVSFSTEDEARAVYKDFGMDFDSDPYRGQYYDTTTKRNPLRRIGVKDEGKLRRKTRGVRSDKSNLAGNSARQLKRQGNLRISKSGTQSSGGSAGSGINIGRG